jgi:hypothetical protein
MLREKDRLRVLGNRAHKTMFGYMMEVETGGKTNEELYVWKASYLPHIIRMIRSKAPCG